VSVSDDPIEKELRAAQSAYLRAPIRRRRAVLAARDADPDHWTIYRLARTLGVGERTIRAILKDGPGRDAKGARK
jgi:hypothetical protein